MTNIMKRLKAEKDQAFEHAKRYILKRDKDFRRNEKITSKVKPIRHPNGKTYKGADYHFFWSDAIWCGDIHIETFLLWADVPDDGDKSIDFLDGNEEALVYYTEKIWNKALKEVLPAVYWCVLSCELDDEPTTPQEEIWNKIASGEIDEEA